jgi:uncharacterized membrane protein YfcA
MLFIVWLLIGLLVGALGTLIGAGGGFLLMPILLFAYREKSPDILTAWSLLAVLANSTSGSIAYARDRKIDYRAGITFALAALPGAWFGARLTTHLSRSTFGLLFGGFLVLAASYLLYRSVRDNGGTVKVSMSRSRSLGLGAALSLFVGAVSNVFGIGGGILHVPLLVYVLGFPAHVATATSHFVLAITVLAGELVHLNDGSFVFSVIPVLPMVLGATAGAQFGARYARRINGTWIIRGLSLGLLAVGTRLLMLR